MTPGRSAPGDAVVSATATSALSTLGPESVVEVVSVATDAGRELTGIVGRTLSSLMPASTASIQPTTTLAPASLVVLVTPVAGGELGVTTAAAVGARTGAIQALLPTGELVDGELLVADGDVAVVRLAGAPSGAPVASGAPRRGRELTVVAYGDEIAVAEGGLDQLTVPEGAPIFDERGALVGLCTIGPDGVEMLPMPSLPDIPPDEGVGGDGTVAATDAPASTDGVPANEPVQSSSPEPATSAVDTRAPDTSTPASVADTRPSSDPSGSVVAASSDPPLSSLGG